MLRVTVELVPLGDESKKKALGVLEIINDGTGTYEKGNYVARVEGRQIDSLVKGWPRLENSVWDLILEILNSTHVNDPIWSVPDKSRTLDN